MWAKRAILLTLAAAGLSGCAQMTPEASWTSARATIVADEDFQKAVTLVAKLQYDAALAEFTRLGPVFNQAGNVPRAAECCFWQGYCMEKLGRRGDAAERYRAVIERAPNTPAAEQARRRLTALQSS